SASARKGRAMCLEGMFEPQERNEAFAAERKIQARDEGPVAVESEPDAIRDVHIPKLEVIAFGGHCAGVDEQGAVERPPRFPSVLGREEQAVAIPETELPEAAKRPGTAQRRLEVEWHLRPGICIGKDRSRMECNGPIGGGDGHVLLEVD